MRDESIEISSRAHEGFLNFDLPRSVGFRKMDCGPLMTNFHPSNRLGSTVIASSAAVFGSLSIPSLTIDRQFGMEAGKLHNRAGIRSVSHAAPNETEV